MHALAQEASAQEVQHSKHCFLRKLTASDAITGDNNNANNSSNSTEATVQNIQRLRADGKHKGNKQKPTTTERSSLVQCHLGERSFTLLFSLTSTISPMSASFAISLITRKNPSSAFVLCKTA